MRIVQALGWYYPESLGGTEAYVAGLARRLGAHGHDVQIAAPLAGAAGERHDQHDGIPVYRYPVPLRPRRDECQGSAPARGAEHFHAWLRAVRPDVFHVHSLVTGLGLAELEVAGALGARVIATNHLAALGFLCQRGTLMRWGRALCDGICVPSKCAACALEARGLPRPLASAAGALPAALSRAAAGAPGRLGTALGMVDLIERNRRSQRRLFELVDRFVVLNRWALDALVANGAPPAKLVLNRLGYSQTDVPRKPHPRERPTRPPVRVGYVGRLTAIKGVHDLARALAALPPELPLRVELRGPADAPEARRVVEEVRALAAGDPRLSFAPAVSGDEVLSVLAGYDVLCCPSAWFENGPTVASEAHAVGTPVIGTRIGGLAELIEDGRSGRLVTPRDWRALAAVLREIARDPAATIDRWRAALPRARSMDEIALDYLPLYEASGVGGLAVEGLGPLPQPVNPNPVTPNP